jgi:hypothetical protein
MIFSRIALAYRLLHIAYWFGQSANVKECDADFLLNWLNKKIFFIRNCTGKKIYLSRFFNLSRPLLQRGTTHSPGLFDESFIFFANFI